MPDAVPACIVNWNAVDCPGRTVRVTPGALISMSHDIESPQVISSACWLVLVTAIVPWLDVGSIVSLLEEAAQFLETIGVVAVDAIAVAPVFRVWTIAVG